MPLDNVQIFSGPAVSSEDPSKSLSSVIPIHVVINIHELLVHPLENPPRKSYHVGVFERHRSLAISTKAVPGHPRIKPRSTTANAIWLDISPCGAIHFHIKLTQCPLLSPQLSPLDLIATFNPQSIQQTARRASRPSGLKTLSPLLHSPLRNPALGNVPRLLLPCQGAKYKTRGAQGSQKRRGNGSPGAESGKKTRRSGGDRSKKIRSIFHKHNEREDGMSEEDDKNPNKMKCLEAELYNDEEEPYMCYYFCRRPDMHARCRGFRRSGDQIHRLKEHLTAHHRLRCYLCNTCLRRFEFEADLKMHAKARSCKAGRARNYLLGFDEAQWAELDPHAEGSPLKGPEGPLAPKAKWEVTYRILFPDTEERGIPDPFQNPDMRDVYRYMMSITQPGNFDNRTRIDQAINFEPLQSSQTLDEFRCMQLIFDILTDDRPFKKWRRKAASNDLNIGTRRRSNFSPRTQSVCNFGIRSSHPDDILAPFLKIPDTDSAYASFSGEAIPPGRGHSRECFSNVSDVGTRRSLDHNASAEPQLSAASSNLLSSPPFFPAPSEISYIQPSQLGLNPSWTSLPNPGSGNHTQIQPGSQFVTDYYDLPTLSPSYSEFNHLPTSDPSALEDQLQMGGQFRDSTDPSFLVSPRVNTVSFHQIENTRNYRPP